MANVEHAADYADRAQNLPPMDYWEAQKEKRLPGKGFRLPIEPPKHHILFLHADDAVDPGYTFSPVMAKG